jgi:uncharacterized protein
VSVIFLDTSALAKNYITERGSSWVQALMQAASGHVIVISQLATVEFVATLARLQREGQLSKADTHLLQGTFLSDRDKAFLSVDLSDSVIVRARSIVVAHPIRALDALHVACALEAAALLSVRPLFISADIRQLSAAAAEGLPTDDPNRHP